MALYSDLSLFYRPTAKGAIPTYSPELSRSIGDREVKQVTTLSPFNSAVFIFPTVKVQLIRTEQSSFVVHQ